MRAPPSSFRRRRGMDFGALIDDLKAPASMQRALRDSMPALPRGAFRLGEWVFFEFTGIGHAETDFLVKKKISGVVLRAKQDKLARSKQDRVRCRAMEEANGVKVLVWGCSENRVIPVWVDATDDF